MLHYDIPIAIGVATLVVAGLLWRELILQRRAWSLEEDQRLDALPRVDLDKWYVGSDLYAQLQPRPRPTFFHRGEPAFPWGGAVILWCILVVVSLCLVVVVHRVYLSSSSSTPPYDQEQWEWVSVPRAMHNGNGSFSVGDACGVFLRHVHNGRYRPPAQTYGSECPRGVPVHIGSSLPAVE